MRRSLTALAAAVAMIASGGSLSVAGEAAAIGGTDSQPIVLGYPEPGKKPRKTTAARKCGFAYCGNVGKTNPTAPSRPPGDPGEGTSKTGKSGRGGSGLGCAVPATLRPLTPDGRGWGKVTTPARGCEVPVGRNPNQPVVSPVVLSRQAGARLPIPKPVIVTAPPRGKTMLVRLPTWFWLDDSQADPRSATARAGGVWAKATASAYRVTVDPGDGSEPVTCDAPGVAYSHDHTAAEEEQACTHAYTHSGSYTVTVTVSWGADWAGSDGNGGTLPTLNRSARFPVKVVQARSELIDDP